MKNELNETREPIRMRGMAFGKMKSFTTALLVVSLGVSTSLAGAIDDVVSKFDRHGLWMNGVVIPIREPEDIEAIVLAEKILTSYRKSTENLEVLEQKKINGLNSGLSGLKAMHVRVTRTSMFPPPPKDNPEDLVIVYHFRGGDTGWWSRIYTIDS